MKRGISGAQASANIPQVDQGKQFNLGVGVGGFDGETAVAIGGSARISKDGILKASVGFGGGGSSSTVWGVGGGWSW
jgi:autotransporter adhesin